MVTKAIEVILKGKETVSKAVAQAKGSLTSFEQSVSQIAKGPDFSEINKATKEFTKSMEEAVDIGSKINETTFAIKRLREQSLQLQKLEDVNVTFNEMGELMDAQTEELLEMEDAVARLNKRFPRFQTELLSIMFAMMAVNRATNSLLQPSMQAAGVFDLLGNILTVMFLPAALIMLDILLWLYEAWEKLPEPIQDFIAIAGLVISAATALGIAITILKMALAPLIGIISGVIAKLGGAGGLFAIIKGVGLVALGKFILIGVLVLAFFLGLKDTLSMFVDALKLQFGGVWESLLGVFKVFKSIFTGDWEGLWDGFKQIVNGFLNFLQGWVKNILLIPITFINGFLKIIDFVLKWFGIDAGLSQKFMESVDRLWEIIDVGFELIRETIFGIIDRIKSGIENALNTLRDIWDSIWGGFSWAIDKFLKPIEAIVDSIFGGIQSAINKVQSPIDSIISKLQWLFNAAGNVSGALGTVVSYGQNIIGGIGNILGLAEGGIVTRPVLAQVGERGPEAVIPLDKLGEFHMGSFSPTINITASISSEMDLRTLARRLSVILEEEFRRRP